MKNKAEKAMEKKFADIVQNHRKNEKQGDENMDIVTSTSFGDEVLVNMNKIDNKSIKPTPL